MPASRRAALLEAARARLCAAGRHANPVDVEAAARAFGVAVTLASLARLGRRLGATARLLWRRARGHGAAWAGSRRVDR